MEIVKWSGLKNIIDNNYSFNYFIDGSNNYEIIASVGSQVYKARIAITNPKNTYQIDFEDNYKSNADSNINTPYIDASLVRTIQNFTPTQMPRSSESYLDFFSLSGRGALSSFVLKLRNDKVTIKLLMDEIVIFETNIEDLDSFDNTAAMYSWLSWNDSNKIIVFKPSTLIRFRSSIQISIKSNENKDKDFDGYIVDYIEG